MVPVEDVGHLMSQDGRQFGVRSDKREDAAVDLEASVRPGQGIHSGGVPDGEPPQDRLALVIHRHRRGEVGGDAVPAGGAWCPRVGRWVSGAGRRGALAEEAEAGEEGGDVELAEQSEHGIEP